jgi:hypothetical protein
MMIYLIAAVGGAGLLLLALKGWSAAKARAPASPSPHAGMTFRTSAGTIDRWVKGADDWWQHLKSMPLFWVGVLGTAIMVSLALHFGLVRGGHWGIVGVIIVAALFGIADLAIPFIALYDATDDGKRSMIGSALLVVATVMSIMAVIGSTSEIATTTAARMDVGLINQKDTLKTLELKQKERDAIPVDRGAQALGDLADANEKAAQREGGRTRCGDKCEALTKLAADYRARQKDANRKEQLTGEIETIKARLSGSGTNETRTDADAMATVISGMSGGLIGRDSFRVYSLPVFGLILVTLLTLLWVYIGGRLHDAIVWERQYRAEIADAQRATLGLAAKFTTPLLATPLLTGPKRTDANADPTVVINMNLADMRRRFANDQDLLATDQLFETLLMQGEGGSVPIAALYRAYQVASLTRDPLARYMTQPTMAAKMMVIAQHRDDMRVTADGVLEGWVLKPVTERNLESGNA